MVSPPVETCPAPWVGPGRGGVRLRIRAVPGARRDGVLGTHGDALRVAVRAPADRGRANEALVALLAEGLGVGRGDIELLSGRSGRDKVLAVRGLDEPSVRTRIARMLDAGASAGSAAR